MKTVILHFKEEDATNGGMPIGRISFESAEQLKGRSKLFAEKVEGKFIELKTAKKIAQKMNIALEIS